MLLLTYNIRLRLRHFAFNVEQPVSQAKFILRFYFFQFFVFFAELQNRTFLLFSDQIADILWQKLTEFLKYILGTRRKNCRKVVRLAFLSPLLLKTSGNTGYLNFEIWRKKDLKKEETWNLKSLSNFVFRFSSCNMSNSNDGEVEVEVEREVEKETVIGKNCPFTVEQLLGQQEDYKLGHVTGKSVSFDVHRKDRQILYHSCHY